MKAAPCNQLLIFIHLPKTAGSTLARILKNQYSSSALLSLYASSFGTELENLPASDLESVRVVMGHFYFGTHFYVRKPSAYITMLRDPIDRVISHYSFVRKDPTHYLHEAANRMTLQEYVTYCDRYEPNNDQTRLLAGNRDAAKFGACSDDMLDVAIANLENHFMVAGLTEDFDRSLILLKRKLCWRIPLYVKQNVNPQLLQKQQLGPETLHTIRTLNALDLELYRYASNRFHQEIYRQGTMFERELQTFQSLNALYGRGQRLVSSARVAINRATRLTAARLTK